MPDKMSTSATETEVTLHSRPRACSRGRITRLHSQFMAPRQVRRGK